MAKKAKKGTNKRKFSLYLDKDLMAEARKQAQELERSVNYVIEKRLVATINMIVE